MGGAAWGSGVPVAATERAAKTDESMGCQRRGRQGSPRDSIRRSVRLASPCRRRSGTRSPGMRSDCPAMDLEFLLERIPEDWARTLDVGAGWFPLLANLDRQLAALAPNYVLYQCKSKYGSLRFYADPGREDGDTVVVFEETISAAEAASATTCEECGRSGASTRYGHGCGRSAKSTPPPSDRLTPDFRSREQVRRPSVRQPQPPGNGAQVGSTPMFLAEILLGIRRW